MKTRKPVPILRADPSRTQTLRRAFAAALARRFARLKGAIVRLVDDEDAFGLKPLPRLFAGNESRPVTANAGQWRFHSDAERVELFRSWLRSQIDASFKGKSDEDAYREFLRQGFARGAGRAFDDVRAKGVQPQGGEFYRGGREEFLRSAFGRPAAVEKLELASRLMFNDLDGVTDQMEAALVRTLAAGLAQGKNPRDIARDLVVPVDSYKGRAEMIARDSVIRVHSEGQLSALEDLGVEEVGAAVEWRTSGLGKTRRGNPSPCPACAPLQGVVLKISEARGMLPRHPGCACSWSPWIEPSPGEKRSKTQIDAAVRASQRKGGKWGPATPISSDRPESVLGNAAGVPGPLTEDLLAFSRLLGVLSGKG